VTDELPVACPECGRRLRDGRRVSAEAVARVLVCLDARTGTGCGHEEPPLYKRSRWTRDHNLTHEERITSGR